MTACLACIACGNRHGLGEDRQACARCGDLLSVERPQPFPGGLREVFDARLASRAPLDQSGVWRFREAVLEVPPEAVVSHPEGGTRLYRRQSLCDRAGIQELFFKHEGENPTGSFKDRGMTVAVTQGRLLGARAVACASTGNTSASLAAYAAQAGLRAIVFVPAGRIALGKLAQTLAYGALCLAVRGDFDAAMRLVATSSRDLGLHLLNSINPFRIEGQKTIVFELLQDLRWEAPEWIVLPAGNLGNTSAFGKALREAREAGWITRVPRLLCVQARGANPFYRGFREGFVSRHRVEAETVATAIRIGDPVSWDRARASLAYTNGVVTDVSDEELLAAKRAIDAAGIGCEPASAVTLAGLQRMRAEGTVKGHERVVCVLTGHLLKDPDVVVSGGQATGRILEVEATLEAVKRALG